MALRGRVMGVSGAPLEVRPDGLGRVLDVLTWPLDRVRQRLWGLSAKTAWGRACIRDRGLRLAVLAVGHMAVAFALTLLAPLWLLLLGPIVLGAPHIASDVRYLLLKPPVALGRFGVGLILAPLAVMTGLRVWATLGGPFVPALELSLGAAAMLGGVAAVRGALMWRGVAGAAVVGLLGVALTAPYTSLVVFAHAHNVVAVGLWVYFLRGEVSRRGLLFIGACYLALGAVLMTPLVDGLAFAHASSNLGAFNLVGMADTMAPGVAIEVGLRWVLLFAFLQSMHYAIWLRLIPQRLDARKAPPTFRRSLGRLREDFGTKGFVVLAVICVAFPLAALLGDAERTRHLYLLAALSHGWIELALVAALVGGRRAR